jgi:hypothetical protein
MHLQHIILIAYPLRIVKPFPFIAYSGCLVSIEKNFLDFFNTKITILGRSINTLNWLNHKNYILDPSYITFLTGQNMIMYNKNVPFLI